MANATIIYACTQDGLVILNRPGTLPEWLPPRRALEGRSVLSAWAEAGPPIKVLAAVAEGNIRGEDVGGAILWSDSGGRMWESVLEAPVTVVTAVPGDDLRLYAGMTGGGLAATIDGGVTWGILPGI